jgi:hypothetical protein
VTNGRGVRDVKTRSIVVLVVAGAAAIAAVGLWRPSPPDGHGGHDSSDSAAPVPPTPASTSGSKNGDDAPTDARVIDPAWQTSSSPGPRYTEPDEIERRLAQFLAEQPGLEIVSLSIECGATACEIAITGREVSPRYVGAYSDLTHRLFAAPWSDLRILFGGLGTREIAPGAREYVLGFEYQPLVDLSADPLIAARQYAACAAAWRRQTEIGPHPDDEARYYVHQAEHYVALAASVLGEQEAKRVAAETRGGPLIRECNPG